MSQDPSACPVPKFQKFERTTIVNERMGAEFAGRRGTVVWRDAPWFNRRTGAWREWAYCVYFPALDRYRGFLESDLGATGEFEDEASLRGNQHEISFDCVMRGDMENVEGSYRLPGELWKIFFFSNEDVPGPRHSFGTWASGITGIEFQIPRNTPINQELVIKAMSEVFHASMWKVIDGPDSLLLK